MRGRTFTQICTMTVAPMLVLEDHIRGCVMSAEPEKQEETLQELMGAMRLSVVATFFRRSPFPPSC